MAEKPQPDPVPEDEPPPHPAEPLQIDTPVIDMQDLEHKPGSTTRVSNKGVKIEPTIDKDVAQAMQEFKKVLSEQLTT
ncbi:MAG: hypothetical protein ABI769_06575 [Pseudomonadota bacterium]